MNQFIKAKLVSLKKINVLIFTEISFKDNLSFSIIKNENEKVECNITKRTSKQTSYFFEITLKENYEFGSNYVLNIEGCSPCSIDVEKITEIPNFDELFSYDKDDLGAIYSKEETKFNLYSPLSSSVLLKLENDSSFIYLPMNRDEYGVFRLSIKEDLLNKKYKYIIYNGDLVREINDPYGKGVSLNSEYSAVVDIEAIKEKERIIPSSPYTKPVDSIIYEVNIRDFTESKDTNIVNKGKFKGFVEENRKTIKGNNKCGLDYLKYLGISHVQLLPVTDFYGVDDINTKDSYNWGYDITSFFALEGSYSSKPEIPQSRLEEFREMVDILHKNNIRVVLDMVFNHIYDWQNSSLENSLPNYYFRKKKNGELSNASGCGNDIATEKIMARKIIVDSCKYFIDVFDVDGFRFDLMGLLDIETINTIVDECRKTKKETIFYGEGWDMGYELSKEVKANYKNANHLPQVGFFNDAYRDFLKGSSFDLCIKGYLSGNLDYVNGVDYSILGSTNNVTYEARFNNANQSINYLECHDNHTLFDKLTASNPEEDEEIILHRVKFANCLLLLSFGVPFIHMGQEIGLSKSSLGNTYNIAKINNMQWSKLDQRMEMVTRLHALIKYRKNILKFLSLDKPEDIIKVFNIEHWNNGIYCLKGKSSNLIAPFSKLIVLFNPTIYQQAYELDDFYLMLSSGKEERDGEKIHMKQGIISPCSLQILYKR